MGEESDQVFDPESRAAKLGRLATLLELASGAWVVVEAEGDRLIESLTKELAGRLAPLPVIEISFLENEPDLLTLAGEHPASRPERAPVLAFRHLSAAIPGLFLNLDLNRESLALLPHRLVFFMAEAERLAMLEQAPNFYSRLRGVFRFEGEPTSKSEPIPGEAFLSVSTGSSTEGRCFRHRPLVALGSERERKYRIQGLLLRLQELETEGEAGAQAVAETLFDVAGLEEADLATRRDAEEHYREAEAQFRRAGNFLAACDALLSAAAVAKTQGRFAAALEDLSKARDLLLNLALPRLEGEQILLVSEVQQDLGRYREAEESFRRAVEKFEVLPEASVLARSLKGLAEVLIEMNRLSEAEPLARRALEIQEKALGSEHPDVAESLNNLAILCMKQGRTAEAEALYLRSQEILEKALGGEHPHVATSLNNLASLFAGQGRMAVAEQLFRRSLEIREKALGGEHPDVATALNNLANFYLGQGRLIEAEPLYQHSLEIWEKAFRGEHPYVAIALDSLAVLRRMQGRAAEAEKLEARAREVRARHEDHNRPGSGIRRIDGK